MFGTIMVLVAMVLITPSLLGHPSELSSLPGLIVAMTHDKQSVIVDVTSFSQPYLYDNITVGVGYENATNATVPYVSVTQNETYSESLTVPTNVSGVYNLYVNPLHVHTKLVDRQGNYFELNVTMRLSLDPGGKTLMVFRFPDDKGSTAVRQTTPPDDFRWPVPRRGMVP